MLQNSRKCTFSAFFSGKLLQVSKRVRTFASQLGHGVMVTLQVLVLSFWVRIPVTQQNALIGCVRDAPISAFLFRFGTYFLTAATHKKMRHCLHVGVQCFRPSAVSFDGSTKKTPVSAESCRRLRSPFFCKQQLWLL